MLFIWKGAGALALAIFVLALLFAEDPSVNAASIPTNFIVAGIIIAVLGFLFRKRADRIAGERGENTPQYGLMKKAVIDTFGDWSHRPSVFFIPMHIAGVLVVVLGLYLLFTGGGGVTAM